MSNEVAETQTPAPPTVKFTGWTQEPELAALKLDIENARPQQSEHIGKINTWLDHLHVKGCAAIKPIAGRSAVQPQLIRKHAEWRYTDLSEPFLSSDKLFTISPRSHEDRPAAEQNEMVLNWQFDTAIDKVSLVDQYVRTAVDEGTVVLRTGWNRKTKKTKIKVPVYGYFSIFKPDEIQALEEGVQLVQQNPEALQSMHPEAAESIRYSMEKQGPYRAKKIGEEEVEQEEIVANHPTVELANIFNLVIDPTCGTDYASAMFLSYSLEMTVGSLKQDKRYKNIEAVDTAGSPLAEPDHVRPGMAKGIEFNFADDSRKKVVVQEYWGYFDIDGTGELTPIVVAWIGNTLVRMEVNPYPDGKPPFVIIPLLPLRNSVYGEPDGALLIDNQKIIGAVTRGMIDIMARSANAQRGMAKSMLDVVNKRRFDAGQDYEFNPNVHPTQGIVEHKFPEIPASAPNMISMQNMDAESLTGIKTFGDQGLSGASLGPTAAGTRGVLSATGRRTNGILRRLAKGMADVGKKIVAMNQEFLSEKEVVRVTNEKFVTVRREDLKGNFDLKVDISTAEEDEAKASRLEFMLQTLGNTGDPGITKIMQAEIARLRRMPDLAYQIKNFQPQPDPMALREQEAKIRKMEAEANQIEAEVDKTRAEAERARAQARQLNEVADKTALDYVEQETGTKHARDVDKVAAQARANTDHTITKAIIERKNGVGADGKVDNTPTDGDIVEAINFNA